MAVGDYVYVTRDADIKILPREVNGQDGRELAESSDTFVGEIHVERDDYLDTVVAVAQTTANVTPGFSTIRTLQEIYLPK